MHRQKGFSLIELLIVVTIILILAAIAIPSLLRARMNANDASAAATIRTLNSAEATYSTTYASSGYAPDLKTLGPNGINCATGTPTSSSACLVDDKLGCTAAPCIKGGYEYWVVSSGSAVPYGDYTASTTPLEIGQTGSRNFCSGPDAVVRQSGVYPSQLSAGETLVNCTDITKYNAINYS